MSWAIGYDDNWNRDIGYGVPAVCDRQDCSEGIDRGLGFVCGNGEPVGGEGGCGLYFCSKHGGAFLCERCQEEISPFQPGPDVPAWVADKLNDPSSVEWREENPEEVEQMRKVAQ